MILRAKSAQQGIPLKPILNLQPNGDGRNTYRTLARVLVRRVLADEFQHHEEAPPAEEVQPRGGLTAARGEQRTKLDVMTTEELARYLGVSAARVLRHVDSRTIPHRRIGGEAVFSRRAVLDWMANDGEL